MIDCRRGEGTFLGKRFLPPLLHLPHLPKTFGKEKIN